MIKWLFDKRKETTLCDKDLVENLLFKYIKRFIGRLKFEKNKLNSSFSVNFNNSEY